MAGRAHRLAAGLGPGRDALPLTRVAKMAGMQLVRPAAEHLASYRAALERSWSPSTADPGVSRVELERIDADPAAFLAAKDDPHATGSPITLPDAEGLSSSGMHAGAADVRPNLLNKRRPALEIRGDNKTGGYLVPRRLVLELSGLPAGGGPIVQEVIGAVSEAVDELGFPGKLSMGTNIHPGVVTWMHMATDDLPLSAVEDAIRRTVQRHDPGTWTLTPISSATWLSQFHRF